MIYKDALMDAIYEVVAAAAPPTPRRERFVYDGTIETNSIVVFCKMRDKNAVFYLWVSHTKTCTSKCDDDYPDLNSHHNERGRKERPDEQPEPQTDPTPEEETAQLTTYDPAGSIPFSEWDGEEGPRP